MYKIKCPLPFIFPGIFIQIDDYEDDNKLEGMKCCQAILKNLVCPIWILQIDFEIIKYIFQDNNKHDATGYVTVIYDSLFKYITYKEIPILCQTMECMMLLLPLLITKKSYTQVCLLEMEKKN